MTAPERSDDAAAPNGLPDEAWVTALTSLPQMGPARLHALLQSHEPPGAWAAVRRGLGPKDVDDGLLDKLGREPAAVLDRWRAGSRAIDPATMWQRHVDAGIAVCLQTSASFPTALLDDISPAPILFLDGDPDAVVGPRVAIVGTRDCTRYGYDIARTLGRELSEVGVAVVSGLALGVDGAAHAGALDVEGAPPIAVVGTGLDVVYPRRNRAIWALVRDRGVIMTEYPLGEGALGWHFPLRNRIIAALADIVIVVESQEAGGSMITADEAIARGTPLMAVPGPVTSKMSSGPNKLLNDGAAPVRDTTDVLIKLNMSPGSRRKTKERRPRPSADDRALLEQFEWQPVTFDGLSQRSGLDLYALTLALDRLVETGWVDHRGGWYERIAKPGG